MSDSIDLSTDSNYEGSEIFTIANPLVIFTQEIYSISIIWKSGDIFFQNLDKLQNTDKPKSFSLR